MKIRLNQYIIDLEKVHCITDIIEVEGSFEFTIYFESNCFGFECHDLDSLASFMAMHKDVKQKWGVFDNTPSFEGNFNVWTT